ncbi:calcium-transporting P-type ATPase, PMR1-type [Clostridia bacterium]|nr:calcium-transporting P-type ATPase, PMR1-type [Clostridia bacterium]
MQGLSTKKAIELQKQYGVNTIEHKKKSKPLKVFFGQFKDVMVMILLIATVISVFVGEVYDAITIILIVLLNAILGFIQEYRTEKTLETLKSLSAPTSKVFRDGKLVELSAIELVPSDLIKIETGDKVPADACLQECKALKADEAILTGESSAVSKIADNEQDSNNDLNKSNIIYSGTNIVSGNGIAKVIATGRNAQIGKISSLLNEIEQVETPLQKRLGELGKIVAIICVAVCFIVFGAGVLRGEPIFEMLMTGITIAIAAIPEGLPATVTIALALAVNRMLKQKALVNRLHSVETLGCTSVICSDKTGTITENKMTVKAIYVGDKDYAVTGTGYSSGEILEVVNDLPYKVNVRTTADLNTLLECCVICETASIDYDSPSLQNDNSSQKQTSASCIGEATELALLILAQKGNINAKTLSDKYTKFDEIPFDSAKKYMSVMVKTASNNEITFTKGAFDVVLPMCSFIQIGKEIVPLTRERRKQITAKAVALADGALRVIALAKDNVFLGIAGMLDPPRAEAIEAIRLCSHSQIKTVMITGDHKNTATAIAKQAGILKPNGKVITGAELDKLSEEELLKNLESYCVYARVNPEHKLRLVRAYKQKGHVVTMTGDGVNDAPAIKEADVGVSMGLTGTDVAKEAADVILMDDNFATLVKAVEQGRTIYANIRKFVRYLLSCNIGEVLTMFLCILMGFPLVLLPVQILLVNLVTDGLPALALSLERSEKNIMYKPPRSNKESFFSNGLLSRIIFRGIMIGLCTLGCFTTILRLGFGVETARTCALLTLVLSQLIHVFECKSETGNIFTIKYFSNPQLLLAVLFSAIVIFSAIYLPPLQLIFSLVSLSQKQLLISAIFSVIIPLITAFNKPTKV